MEKYEGNVSRVIVNSFVPLLCIIQMIIPWIFVSIAIFATIGTIAFNMLIWADIID